MKNALITGITGQDGYYLSKFLLEKDFFSSSSSTSDAITSKDIPESSRIFFLIEEFDARIILYSAIDSELKIDWS